MTAQIYTVKCKCGVVFQSSYWSQKYCSSSCAKETRKEKIKEQSKDRLNRCRFTIFHRDAFRCFYCGRSSFGDSMELGIDHIVPESKGGESKAKNLVTSCRECNSQKGRTIITNESELLDEVSRRNIHHGVSGETLIKTCKK